MCNVAFEESALLSLLMFHSGCYSMFKYKAMRLLEPVVILTPVLQPVVMCI
jgi:hypothetical protein